MLKIYNFDVYWLLNLSDNLSFLTPFLAAKFDMSPKILLECFSIDNFVGESVVLKRIYQNYSMSILHKIIPCDLVEHDMDEFDVILGMDWLYTSYASIVCRTHKVKFQIPNEPISEWLSSDLAFKGRFISYLKAQKLIYKGFIYHIMIGRDVDSESHTLESVPIVNELLNVFLKDFSGIPLK